MTASVREATETEYAMSGIYCGRHAIDSDGGGVMTRKDFEPGPLGDVSHEHGGRRWTLVFVRTLRHPPERVWTALTEPSELDAWSPWAADRDLGRPGEATLTMIDGDTREPLEATITTADAPTLLEYTVGGDTVRWELAPAGQGTRLTLRHTVEDRDWLPKVAAGWHLCLDVAERLLDGRPVGPIRGQEAMEHGWQELHDRYADVLGVAEGAGAAEKG
jgi:uncharacterized protein YndB with AHSA1/START domain